MMGGKKQGIVDELFEYLKEKRLNPRRQVKAGERMADIVTDDAVYEVVANIDAGVIRSEVPHVLACRNELNPELRAIIYGKTSLTDLAPAVEAASKWGVTVKLLKLGEKPS